MVPKTFANSTDLFSGSDMTGMTRCRRRALNTKNKPMATKATISAQRVGLFFRRNDSGDGDELSVFSHLGVAESLHPIGYNYVIRK
jgi:hypothetical protein